MRGNQLERINDLYFELSNEDRLKILFILQDHPEKLTVLSKEIEITHQQCIRHLNRLVDNKLVAKKNDGSYLLTSYGEAILEIHPAFRFLSENREYFLTHSLSRIPSKFITRIGELCGSILILNVMEAISEIESMIKTSSEILWVIINKRTGSVRPFVANATERGVEIRSISLTSYISSLDVKREIVEEDELKIVNAESIGKAIVADETEFDIYLWLTEKAVFISFPLVDGTFDYTGFISSDPISVNYCRDLFLYYWDRANIIQQVEIVERHLNYLRKHGLK